MNEKIKDHLFTKGPLICLLITIMAFAALLAYIWDFTVDDAYITFRYALHLSQGFGIVWNVGEFPAEGYSNFLWVLITSVLILFKLNPVLFTKFIGIAAVAGNLYLYLKISRAIFEDKKLYLASFCAAAALLLINPATAIHAISGLETMLYAMLILFLTYLTFRLIKSFNKRTLYYFAFISLACSLLRPEGILVSLGLFVLIYFMAINKSDENKIKLMLPFILAYLMPAMLYMAFRVYYFNEIFPLPFLVKTVSNGSFASGIYSLSNALSYMAPFLMVILITFLNKIEPIFNDRTHRKFCILLITTAVTIISANIIYLFSSLYMNYAQRFYYPSFVLVYIITGISLIMLIHEIKSSMIKMENLKQLSTYISFIIVFLLLLSNISFSEDFVYLHESGERFPVSYITLGTELNKYSNLNLTFASIDSGSLPYLSNWNQVDMVGLNDKFIAKEGLATQDYINKRNPQLVILISGDGSSPMHLAKQEPFIKFVKDRDYNKLPSIKYKKDYYLLPYIDPDIPEYKNIVSDIRKASATSWK